MEDYLPVLRRTAVFEGIGEAEIAELCRAFGCRSAYYPRGSALWRRGDPVESAGIVLSGCIQAEQNGADGALRVAARHGAGALFGDVLMSSRLQRSPVDVVAAEDTHVLFLPLGQIMRDTDVSCRDAQVRFRLNLLAEISDKYWALYRRLGWLSAPSLRAKLARRLLSERAERGTDSFVLSGTRETLAAELGANRSALSRELGALQRAGLLRARRGSFVLCDIAALRRLADE